MDSETATSPDVAPPLDLAGVPDQKAVIAARCPVRADLDHSSLTDQRLEPDDSVKLRGRLTREHVREIWAKFAESAQDRSHVVVIDRGDPDGIELTRRALASSARIIVGAHLPSDSASRRKGRRVVLVRRSPDPDQPRNGWVPIEVRRHAFTRRAEGSTVRRSSLSSPHPDSAAVVADTAIRSSRHNENGLQLAHQWRLLEAMGAVDASDHAVGGVVDANGDLWWVDLEAPRCKTRWSPTEVSMLAHYDHAFGFRLEVIANRLARERDPTIARRVLPVHIGQCSTCPWDPICLAEMTEQDHVSLIPRSTFDHYLAHRERNIHTRAQIAQLHWPTAFAMQGSDARSPTLHLSRLLDRVDNADDLDPSTPITDLLRSVAERQFERTGVEGEAIDSGSTSSGRPSQSTRPAIVAVEHLEVVEGRLRDIGIERVCDLNTFDPLTASYSGANAGHLPTVIDQARAAHAHQPYLARGIAAPAVRRAQVEVDIDMENVEDGVYLWGTLITGRADDLSTVGIEAGYRPFLSWQPMNDTSQAEVFASFWAWLADLRYRCKAAEVSFACYCYTKAEHNKMLQILDAASEVHPPLDHVALPARHEIDDLVASRDWVDLYDVVKKALVLGHGLGLKRVAPLAGFHWRDDDAGGLQSMTWHREAITSNDPEVVMVNRERLLEYNEDDVRATHALREWLTHATITPISMWEPPPNIQ